MARQDSNFQVDLHGVVDLLSHHLYSSPRVYLRELLQNAVDAITARQRLEPDTPARISITADGGSLTVEDTGIGLTGQEVVDLLATIGRSSKRDDIGFARDEFLGQFGIGLLSAFMVADEIEVETRHGRDATQRWTGRSDGSYSLSLAPPRAEPGSTVTLRPRRGSEQWFDPATVTDLVTLFGSALPVELTVNGVAVTGASPPWAHGQPERRRRLMAYAEDVFGFTPFDVIDLDVPESGLHGVAFVLPFPTSPVERPTHRVYLKRMLLSEHAEGLLPDWAFFARCVVDTTLLRPTASREALYDDQHLEETRDALADQIRAWLIRLGTTDPLRLTRFLETHRLGVKALALHDDEMLRLVERWVPFETSHGSMTLLEARQRFGEIRYTGTTEEFRQLAAVAAAQGIGLVNGGYVYDEDLLQRLADTDPDNRIERFEPTELATSFDALEPGIELALRPFLGIVQEALEPVGCEPILRAFDPPSLPALYLADRAANFAAERRETRNQADDMWAGVLDALGEPDDARPQLVLNHRSPLVRRLTVLKDDGVVHLAVEGLYGHALMLGHHPIRASDSVLLNRSFLGLLEQAVTTEEQP